MEFKVGDIVTHRDHPEFGEGKIVYIHGQSITIDFENPTGRTRPGSKEYHGWLTSTTQFLKLIRKGTEDETKNIKWFKDGKLVKSFEHFITEAKDDKFYVGQEVIAFNSEGKEAKGVIIVKHDTDGSYWGIKFYNIHKYGHDLDGACDYGYGYWVMNDEMRPIEEEKTIKTRWYKNGKFENASYKSIFEQKEDILNFIKKNINNIAFVWNTDEEMVKIARILVDLGFEIYNKERILMGENERSYEFMRWDEYGLEYTRCRDVTGNKTFLTLKDLLKLKEVEIITRPEIDPYDEEDWGYTIKESIEELDPYGEEDWDNIEEEDINIGDKVLYMNKSGTIYDIWRTESKEFFLVFFDKKFWSGSSQISGAKEHGISDDYSAWVGADNLKKINKTFEQYNESKWINFTDFIEDKGELLEFWKKYSKNFIEKNDMEWNIKVKVALEKLLIKKRIKIDGKIFTPPNFEIISFHPYIRFYSAKERKEFRIRTMNLCKYPNEHIKVFNEKYLIRITEEDPYGEEIWDDFLEKKKNKTFEQ